MDEEHRKESEQEVMERFDREVRAAALEASNEYRKEHGYPLMTAEEVADVDILSALKERFGGGDKTEASK